jgi:hypothetical protein
MKHNQTQTLLLMVHRTNCQWVASTNLNDHRHHSNTVSPCQTYCSKSCIRIRPFFLVFLFLSLLFLSFFCSLFQRVFLPYTNTLQTSCLRAEFDVDRSRVRTEIPNAPTTHTHTHTHTLRSHFFLCFSLCGFVCVGVCVCVFVFFSGENYLGLLLFTYSLVE